MIDKSLWARLRSAKSLEFLPADEFERLANSALDSTSAVWEYIESHFCCQCGRRLNAEARCGDCERPWQSPELTDIG